MRHPHSRRLFVLALALATCTLSEVARCSPADLPVAALRSAVQADAARLDADGSTAHQACERTLADTVQLQQPLRDAVTRRDVSEFHRLQVELSTHLRSLRRSMEQALLVGAWKAQPAKGEGFDLTWRLDAAESLNFIASAYSGPIYKLPTGEVPASAADATQRLFRELDLLTQRVSALNATLGAQAASAGPAHVERVSR